MAPCSCPPSATPSPPWSVDTHPSPPAHLTSPPAPFPPPLTHLDRPFCLSVCVQPTATSFKGRYNEDISKTLDPTGMDVVEIIKAEHKLVDTLFEAYKSESNPQQKASTTHAHKLSITHTFIQPHSSPPLAPNDAADRPHCLVGLLLTSRAACCSVVPHVVLLVYSVESQTILSNFCPFTVSKRHTQCTARRTLALHT